MGDLLGGGSNAILRPPEGGLQDQLRRPPHQPHYCADEPLLVVAGMPIDDESLARHIEEQGPFRFHVTDALQREAISRDGLRPGSELGHFVRDDLFRTRSRHVYLCDRPRGVPVVPVECERMTLEVDLQRDLPQRENQARNSVHAWGAPGDEVPA
jgi:hypothetical protein